MADICTDNRFELIKKYKQKLIECTNVESTPEEMAVLDNILFRFWQMGWLDKLELPPVQPEQKKGKWIMMSDADGVYWDCSECGEKLLRVSHYNPQFDLFPRLISIKKTNYCPSCGADMRGERI